MRIRMWSQDDGDGVKKTEDDSKLDRIAEIDGQLTTRVHRGQTVPTEKNKALAFPDPCSNTL